MEFVLFFFVILLCNLNQMKESKFIDQKKQQWTDFEKENQKKNRNPRLLSKYFIQITDDLSFARTFYRNRLVRVYLNGAAQHIFHGIYKNQKNALSKFKKFWTEELPIAVYKSRKAFIISFSVFLLSFLIGMLSAANDENFSKLILGEEYIRQTLENIEKGDPMAIYKQELPADMFFAITLNNLQVAFRTFVFGVFVSLGTILIMMYNGIMVGTFQYFFIERGLFWESFLTIWQHGTLEISAIIIAGAAGLVMGKGLIFPQTLSRFTSFKLSAKKGLKILAGIVPIIIFAAFIESFFTRYTNAPDFIRILVILFSLAFMLFYFVWFPFKQSRNPKISQLEEETLPAGEQLGISKKESYSNQELTSNTFRFLRTSYSGSFRFIFASSFITISLICLDLYINNHADFEIQSAFISNAADFFNYEDYPIFYFFNVILITILGLLTQKWVSSYFNENFYKSRYSVFVQLINHLILASVLSLLCFADIFSGILLIIFLLPLFEIVLYTSYVDNVFIFNGFKNAFRIINHSKAKLVGLYIKLLLFGLVLLLLISLPILWQLLTFLIWNVYLQEDYYYLLSFFLRMFIMLSFLIFVFGIIKTGIYLFYYTAKEAYTAQNLKERINNIGLKKRVFGYEVENH